MTKKTNTKKNAAKNWERKASAPIEVTEVKFNWFNDGSKGKVMALGKLTLNGCIDIAISVVEGKDGLFTSFPQRESNGKYYSQVFIADKSVLETINETVIEAYEENEDDLPFNE